MFIIKNGKKVYQRDPDWKIKETWEDYPSPKYDIMRTYCKVAFEDSERTFYYRTRNPELKVGDKVYVPFGRDFDKRIGAIISMEDFLGSEAPFPLWKTKHIVDKVENMGDRTLVKLTQGQIELLEKYNIPYTGMLLDDLLTEMDDAMSDYLDDEGEPMVDYDILEELYDAICEANE